MEKENWKEEFIHILDITNSSYVGKIWNQFSLSSLSLWSPSLPSPFFSKMLPKHSVKASRSQVTCLECFFTLHLKYNMKSDALATYGVCSYGCPFSHTVFFPPSLLKQKSVTFGDWILQHFAISCCCIFWVTIMYYKLRSVSNRTDFDFLFKLYDFV